VKRVSLQLVQHMPRQLSPGILYVCEEFSIAGHLCACRCGNKVMTPLGPAEWKFTQWNGLPSLWPSIGNWQLPCWSHYVIGEGHVHWAAQRTDAQIIAGRRAEEQRRQVYYGSLERGWWVRLWSFLGKLFRH